MDAGTGRGTPGQSQKTLLPTAVAWYHGAASQNVTPPGPRLPRVMPLGQVTPVGEVLQEQNPEFRKPRFLKIGSKTCSLLQGRCDHLF